MEALTVWLREWGTLAVAGLALAQPWLLAAYRRWFRRPQIQAYPISSVEVGYSQLGATIGLHGTLLASGREVFVHSINLEVVRRKDNATHDFVWALFRGFKAKASEFHDVEMELAGGFILKPDQPRRYNILFQDAELSADVRDALESLQSEWLIFHLDSLLEPYASGSTPADPDTAYQDFARLPVHRETLTQIDRLRYWEPGRYGLTMQVNTNEPDGTYEFSWEFELTKPQEELLKLNSAEMVSAACDHGTGTYRFAYSDYQDPVASSEMQRRLVPGA